MITIAHLSDTHFGGHDGAAERVRRSLAHVAAMHPGVDVVVVTGDIADHGTDEEYHEARQVLGGWTGPARMLLCPGNHDVREPYLRILRDAIEPAERADEVHDVAGVRFVMLDSLISAPPGERIDPGHLEDASLATLADALADGLPTVVCLHHPPADLHITMMDRIKLDNAGELERIVAGHDNVLAVLTGHAHTASATTFAGRPLLIGGGIASTVTLDGEDLPPLTTDLPASFAVHFIGEDARVVTHWRSLP